MANTQSISTRAILYGFLSRLHTYPLDVGVLNIVAELSLGGSASLRAGLEQMQSAIKGAEDKTDLLKGLQLEATRLFEGPGQPVAPPFGSFYLNGKRLMGPEAAEVRKAYLAAGVWPDADKQLPPDHIAVELGFMSALAQNHSDITWTVSGAFLKNHLITWVPTWRNDVVAAKPHPFYQGLLHLTMAILEMDQEWLAETQPVSVTEELNALE